MNGKTENTQKRPKWGSFGTRLGKRLDEALLALGFMTRVPVPYRSGSVAKAAWAFPLAGAIVGAGAGLIAYLASIVGLPPVVVALLALVTSAMMTGALHEDGLADCADGLWGGATPERRLEIMRDSRSGAYGVLALILATGLKAQLIATLLIAAGPCTLWVALILVHATARAGLPLVMHYVRLAGKSGLAAMVGRPSAGVAFASIGLTTIFLVLLLSCAVMIGMLGPMVYWVVPATLALAGLSAFAVGWLARSKLGGINGDSLGCIEQVSEIACLGGLVVLGGMV